MVADDALNYCEASAVVLRMGCSTAATGSHFCEKRQRVLREIKARMRKTECLEAIFSAEGHFAITAITCAITKFSVATHRHSVGYRFQ